jgi:hypothetical protein
MSPNLIFWCLLCAAFAIIAAAMVRAPNHSIKARVILAVLAIAASAAGLPFVIHFVSVRLLCIDLLPGAVGLWYIAYNGMRLSDPAFFDSGNYFQTPEEDADQNFIAERKEELRQERRILSWDTHYGMTQNNSSYSQYFYLMCVMAFAVLAFVAGAVLFPDAPRDTSIQPVAPTADVNPQPKPQTVEPVLEPPLKPVQQHHHHQHHQK